MNPKRLSWRLDLLMKEKGLTQEELAEMTGISAKGIGRYIAGNWDRVSRSVLGRLSAALDVDVGELFDVTPADVWFPVRRSGEVTAHLGSTSLESRDAQITFPRLGIGTWDVRSLFHVLKSVNRTRVGAVEPEYAEHVEGAYDPARVDELFRKGNHLVLGSPLVNPIAEDVICRAWGIPREDPTRAKEFPYRFRWDRRKVSAFGEYAGTSEPGIVPRGSRETIARRTLAEPGEEGEDCGLVFTYRHNPAGEKASEDDDCMITAILGYSGASTYGGAQLLCRDDIACALYPAARNSGVLRAFRVKYRRPKKSTGFDDREIVSSELIPVA